MTSIELGKKCRELNKQYRDIFGYVPVPSDYDVSITSEEYITALKRSVEEKQELKNYIKMFIKCYSCNHKWVFDDLNIPDGEKYEVSCPHCGAMLMRKKV